MTAVLLASLLFVVTGWPIVRRFDAGASTAVAIAQSFLLGTLAQAVTLYVLSEAGLRWSRPLLLVAPLALLLVSRFIKPEATTTHRAGVAWPELAVIFVVALLHALFGTIAPITEWDFLAMWGMKANAFFDYRGIDWVFLERPEHRILNPDYPPLLPVVYTISTFLRGAWEERFLALFTTFFGVAAAAIACDGARIRRLALYLRIPAMIALTLVAFSNRIGLAEAPLIAFTIAALLRLRDGLTSPSLRPFLLGAVFLGAASWTKNEGLALVASVLLAVLVAGAWRRMLHLWPAVALAVWWQTVRALHDFRTERTRGNPFLRMAETLSHFSEWSPQLWITLEKPAFWIAMLVIAAAAGARAFWRERFITAALLAQFAAFFAAYLSNYVGIALELEHSWERISHQLALVTVVTVLLAWHRRNERLSGLQPLAELRPAAAGVGGGDGLA
ncbi:MAG TPA: hypothetical protein VGF69_24565 [Thermoanaerobaculia bacterium]|jgi:hypothetical protein